MKSMIKQVYPFMNFWEGNKALTVNFKTMYKVFTYYFSKNKLFYT